MTHPLHIEMWWNQVICASGTCTNGDTNYFPNG